MNITKDEAVYLLIQHQANILSSDDIIKKLGISQDKEDELIEKILIPYGQEYDGIECDEDGATLEQSEELEKIDNKFADMLLELAGKEAAK